MASLDGLRIGEQKMKLLDLPNEILLHALYPIPTLQLLNWRVVNHRFRNLIERIVHGRLLVAASLRDWKLIVECYHPSSQYSEPYVFCEYLGTPNLVSDIASQNLMGKGLVGLPGEGLRGLLSRFRPTLWTPETKIMRSHPAGDIPGSRTMELASSTRPAEGEPVERRVNLDSHERFSQLMFNASLVRIGPRKGVFLALANVLETKTMRIFRDWLARSTRAASEEGGNAEGKMTHDSDVGAKDHEMEHEVVWINQATRNAGLKIKVRELKWKRDIPILLNREEDQNVSYSLELKELHISIVHLLLAIERKLSETDSDTGRAMIFGSFPTSAAQSAQTAQ